MNKQSFEDSKTLQLAILLVLITVIVYLPVIMFGGFIWDDDRAVIENTLLKNGKGLVSLWFHPSLNINEYHYWPLVYTVFWFEYHLFGLNPIGYHLVNVLFHSLNAILLWMLLRRLSVPGALFAAAIFALHPVHVESAAWITELKDTLSAMFYLLAFICFFQFLKNKNIGLYIFTIVLFLCSLLSKSITVTFPLAILLVLWWKQDTLRKKDIFLTIPFFIVGGIYSIFDFIFTRHQEPLTLHFIMIEKFLIAGRAVCFYIGKIFSPHHLVAIYPRWQINTHSIVQYVYPFAVIILLLMLWLLRKKLGKGMFTAVLFFVVTLFPILGFTIFGYMDYSYVADRFQYLASAGIIVLFSSIIFKGAEILTVPQSIKYAVAVILLCILGILTWQQTILYKDKVTLFSYNLSLNPNSSRVHFNLGSAFFEIGDIDKAIIHFKEALRIEPNIAEVNTNLGVVLVEKGKFYEAIPYFAKTIQITPNDAEAYNNMGYVLYRAKRFDDAITYSKKALEIDPNNAKAYFNMADSLYEKKEYSDAIKYYLVSIKYNPANAEVHCNVSHAFIKQGNIEEAIHHLREAMQIQPNMIDAANNLAWLLAAGEDAKLRNGSEAISIILPYCQSVRPYHTYKDADILDTLAAGYAEVGNYIGAVKTAQDALNRAQSKNENDLAQRIQKRLEAYKKRQMLYSNNQ